MSKIRPPRSIDGATGLLARFADLDAELAAAEAARNIEIGRINAAADTVVGPLLEELEQLRQALAVWWMGPGKALAPKGRKSLELGGCMVGSRATRATLTIAGEEKDVVAALSGLRWAKPFLRVKTSLDRTALLKSIDGKHQVALAELGVARADGEEQFFVERVAQPGSISA